MPWERNKWYGELLFLNNPESALSFSACEWRPFRRWEIGLWPTDRIGYDSLVPWGGTWTVAHSWILVWIFRKGLTHRRRQSHYYSCRGTKLLLMYCRRNGVHGSTNAPKQTQVSESVNPVQKGQERLYCVYGQGSTIPVSRPERWRSGGSRDLPARDEVTCQIHRIYLTTERITTTKKFMVVPEYG